MVLPSTYGLLVLFFSFCCWEVSIFTPDTAWSFGIHKWSNYLIYTQLIEPSIDTPWDEPTMHSEEFMAYVNHAPNIDFDPWDRLSSDVLCK